MACIIVPAVEAVVVTTATHVMKKKQTADTPSVQTEDHSLHIPMSRQLSWLSSLLWGGVFLLAFEHVWHGEIVPWFPFLTAAGTAADAAEMFHEMSTVGVGMAALVTAIWAILAAVANCIAARPASKMDAAKN